MSNIEDNNKKLTWNLFQQQWIHPTFLQRWNNAQVRNLDFPNVFICVHLSQFKLAKF